MTVEEKRKYNRDYYNNHKSELQDKSRKHARNRDPEVNRVSCKRYRKAHIEERRMKGREYYKAHKKDWPARNIKWAKANRDWRRARDMSKRTGEDVKVELLKSVVQDNVDLYGELTCVYCENPIDAYHIEHRIPVSRGGDSSKKNLCISCASCNGKKGNMTAEEFIA